MDTQDIQEIYKLIDDNIQKYGLHIMGVGGNETRPGFHFTIGLSETDIGAEIIVFGLPYNVGAQILNNCAQLDELVIDQVDTRVFASGYRAIFKEADLELVEDWTSIPERFYGHKVKYLQLVWPDKTGKFPWEEGSDLGMMVSQPLLFTGGVPLHLN